MDRAVPRYDRQPRRRNTRATFKTAASLNERAAAREPFRGGGIVEHWPEKTCAKEVGEDKPSSDPVFAPLDQVLTAGGDARLHLDPATLLNGYGCRPFPRPEAYTFASSTATSISDRGYRAAGAMHQALMDAAAAGSKECELRGVPPRGVEEVYSSEFAPPLS